MEVIQSTDIFEAVKILISLATEITFVWLLSFHPFCA
jgi:hypothetical protein